MSITITTYLHDEQLRKEQLTSKKELEKGLRF